MSTQNTQSLENDQSDELSHSGDTINSFQGTVHYPKHKMILNIITLILSISFNRALL